MRARRAATSSQELAKKIRKTRLSKEARDRANAELKKLRAMAPMSAEATVARNYLDVLLGLPWGKKSKLKKDIAEAQAVLDEDHYGLEKVKDRIVEYLAVQARTNKLKGPILCLVGPPGVGKTSLGRSIARATGREFARQSLGGVRDEAEIRGHRRTYIGSLPGKIISNLKKAGTSNPLFLLDEIDKLGQDFRGDPASALLEVLDPEQNSQVPGPLSGAGLRSVRRDVRHHGELARHAAAAARPHGDHPARGLHRGREGRDRQAPSDPQADGSAWPQGRRARVHRRGAARNDPLLHSRSRRPHARARAGQGRSQGAAQDPRRQGRERCRHAKRTSTTSSACGSFRYGVGEEEDQVGAVTGLAWTEVGGELLTIEAVTVPGKGQIKTTGKLGEVMQESIQAAMSFVKARARPMA